MLLLLVAHLVLLSCDMHCLIVWCALHVPHAAAAAVLLQGQTAIRNVYNWRVKETERMVAIVTELGKLGAQVGRLANSTGQQPAPDISMPLSSMVHQAHKQSIGQLDICLSARVWVTTIIVLCWTAGSWLLRQGSRVNKNALCLSCFAAG
jgi:hypothetical protein